MTIDERIMRWAMAQNVPARQKIVLVSIALYADRGVMVELISDISKVCGLGGKLVTQLDKLKELGLINYSIDGNVATIEARI
jgi:hypothetical protein